METLFLFKLWEKIKVNQGVKSVKYCKFKFLWLSIELKKRKWVNLELC